MKKRNLKEESINAKHNTFWNREKVLNSKQCGCFVCEVLFSPELIKDWTDEYSLSNNLKFSTALCPYCSEDTIIPESDEYTLDKKLLEYVHNNIEKIIKELDK